jgi:hypothetical protein
LQVLGPGIISASVPVTVGYSIHAVRNSGDKGWAVAALVVGILMSLPVLWVLCVILWDVVTGNFSP